MHKRNYCGVTGPSGLAGTSEGLHPVHKRQKTEKSSTGEAEKSSKAEVEKSSMCDAHSERQRVSDGDIYKQMVVDQDVVDTRRHPGGVGKSSKSDAEARFSTSFELKAHIVMEPTAAASGSATHAAVSLKKHVLSMTMLSCVWNLVSWKVILRDKCSKRFVHFS